MSSAYCMFVALGPVCGMSDVYIVYNVGDNELPCGTPVCIVIHSYFCISVDYEAVQYFFYCLEVVTG